ncbi:hypothetical protein [Xanthobacter aminoxidans]|uniref:Uncharacterized protein n=1 Tax=Xanthobacter aminoxidans TaxID=186280 RepID=A0ABW6ZIK3_9HYPH
MSTGRTLGDFGQRSGILLPAAGRSVMAEARETFIVVGVFAGSAAAGRKTGDAGGDVLTDLIVGGPRPQQGYRSLGPAIAPTALL